MLSNLTLLIYIEILFIGILLLISLPFIIDDLHNKFKVKKLVKDILESKKFKKYDIKLIGILA